LDAGAEPAWLIVGHYLHARLGYPDAAPTPADVARFLARHGLARSIGAQAYAFYTACDVRFAPHTDVALALLRAEARCLIQAMEADKCLA
jgi:hypothetical protein